MTRVRAADDFQAIRLRLEELRNERAQRYRGEPTAEPAPDEPDAAAHVPDHLRRRLLLQARRSSPR